MTEINFYQLTISSRHKALPKLLEKILNSQAKTLVLCRDENEMGVLNDMLWTFSTKIVLPHGSKNEGYACRQPIYLTVGDENPNNATIAVTIDGLIIPNIENFIKCLDVFEGADRDVVQAASDRMREYQKLGHKTNWFVQTSVGAWEKAAAHNV